LKVDFFSHMRSFKRPSVGAAPGRWRCPTFPPL